MKLIFYVIYLKYWKEYEVDLLRDISEIPERI